MRSHLDVYDKLLRLQTDMSFDLEEVLRRSASWGRAQTVLDIGCGNGAYARRLAARYPDKRILGLEPDADLLACHKSAATPSNLKYINDHVRGLDADYFADQAVCRLVLMYVQDPDDLARWAIDHVGSIILIDPADDLFSVSPELPGFEAILAKNSQRIAQMGGQRDITNRIVDIWSAAGFELMHEQDLTVPSSLRGSKHLMHHLMVLNAELIDGTPLKPDIHEELLRWSLDYNSYLQYGFRCRTFTRNAVRKG